MDVPSYHTLIFCKDVSHLVLRRLQIEAVVLLRIDLDRHALMDLKSEAGKSVNLLRIVRERSLKDFTPRSLRSVPRSSLP